jgi:hypothetical protein
VRDGEAGCWVHSQTSVHPTATSMLAGQLVLAVCYGLVCLGCAWQVAVIWFHGHMLRSYRVGFLSLSGFWTVLRAAFWLNSSREAVVLMAIFDWMPTAGQLASYMLFLVFCEKQVHPRQWGRRSCRCWLMCGGATLASVATIIGAWLVTAWLR